MNVEIPEADLPYSTFLSLNIYVLLVTFIGFFSFIFPAPLTFVGSFLKQYQFVQFIGSLGWESPVLAKS